MRAIRFLALIFVVIVAFLATPTFALEPLATLIPADLLADSTLFFPVHRWVMEHIARFALLLTSCAGLTFGLLTIPWPVETRPSLAFGRLSSPNNSFQRYQQHKGRRWLGRFVLFVAGSTTVTLSMILRNSGQETLLLQGTWVGSLILFLFAAALLTDRPTRSSHSPMSAATPAVQNDLGTESNRDATFSWATLLTLLIFAILLYAWKLTTLPATVDELTVRIGLHALEMVQGDRVELFSPVTALSEPIEPYFGLALTPTALLTVITGDLLLSTRLAGLLAALLCALGIWLISGELFARQVNSVEEYVPIEDNGQSLAVLATLLMLTNMGLLYYSRLPIALTATAWGLLGCWALLHGIHRRDRLAIGLSGLLIGLGILFHSGAMVYGFAAFLWWIGFGVARLGLLPHETTEVTPGLKDPDQTESSIIYSGDFLLWLLGLLCTILPFMSHLGQVAQLWFAHIPISLSTSLTTLFTSFGPPGSLYPAPLFNVILLPLIPLALGVLLFNLDRRQGWLISTWLLSGLVLVSLRGQGVITWAYLLPLVPASILAMTLTLDRLRVTLLRIGGLWLQQFIAFSLFGLVLWSAFHNGITYYTFGYQQSSQIDRLGYVLRDLDPGQTAIIIQQTSEVPVLAIDTPQLQFFTTGTIGLPMTNIEFVTEIPLGLTPGTLMIVPAQENSWLPAIEASYPHGEYHVERDYYANPLLYVYTIFN